MTVKDFLSGIELNYKTTITLDWYEERNDTIVSEVSFNGNRVSVFDSDDMYNEFIKAFGDYKIRNWRIRDNNLILDVIREV